MASSHPKRISILSQKCSTTISNVSTFCFENWEKPRSHSACTARQKLYDDSNAKLAWFFFYKKIVPWDPSMRH